MYGSNWDMRQLYTWFAARFVPQSAILVFISCSGRISAGIFDLFLDLPVRLRSIARRASGSRSYFASWQLMVYQGLYVSTTSHPMQDMVWLGGSLVPCISWRSCVAEKVLNTFVDRSTSHFCVCFVVDLARCWPLSASYTRLVYFWYRLLFSVDYNSWLFIDGHASGVICPRIREQISRA